MNIYKPEGSLYFYKGHEQEAYTVAEALMNQKYVVMLSKEEGATVLSYIQTYESGEADRNWVAFMSCEEFDSNFYEKHEED